MSTNAHEACPNCGANMYSTLTEEAEEDLENGVRADVECSKCGTGYIHVPYFY